MNLMIDDLVQEWNNDHTETHIIKVEKPTREGVYDKYNHFHDIDWIEPIPLTPEILEKNKFKLNEKESKFLSKASKTKILAYDFPEILGCRFFIEYNVERKVAYLTDHCYIPIRYVNEFQQLLRLISTRVEQVKQILNNFTV